MVDSDRGITNLHVPSDVIIDASMPAAIRTSGQMWNAEGEQQDTKFVIPDHSYAPLYAETIDHCREHGAFDPATMGTTPNVGLMAQEAEEYGSHDKTFEIAERRARSASSTSAGTTLLEHAVATGDIWRDVPDQGRARSRTGSASPSPAPAPPARRRCSGSTRPAPTTRELLKQGPRRRSAELDTDGLQIEILDVAGGDALHARARPRRRGHDLASPATSCATT